MSLKDSLLESTVFPERFQEQKDGTLTLDFVAAERKTTLSSRKVSYHCRLFIDEADKTVMFFEILREKGSGISGDPDTGWGFKKEKYRTTGTERSGSIIESSQWLGKGFNLSFDYGAVRDAVRREAESRGYAFTTTLRESAVTKRTQGVSSNSGVASFKAGTKVTPSKWYYALALLVLIVGISIFAVNLTRDIRGVTAGLQRMVVPRSYYITLTETGRYTVFYEYRSAVNGVAFVSKGDIAGMEVSLVLRQTGERMKLSRPSVTYSYSAGVEGVSILEFDIAQPGAYQFSAWYQRGYGPEVVLAIGSGMKAKMAGSILGSVAILGTALGIAIIIGLLTFVKRRRRKRGVGMPSDAGTASSIEP